MAELYKIGVYENDAEKWAAEFLRDSLPDRYRIYTNLNIHYNGQVFEVDQIIVADYAIALVDVKGYRGKVHVGQGTASVGGKLVADAYGKIMNHVRHVPGTWKQFFGERFAPWFRGALFITGDKGENLDLVVENPDLKVFSVDRILAYLQQSEHETEHNRVTDQTVARLEQFLAVTHRVRQQETTLGDFQIVSRPNTCEALSAWVADYRLASICQRYFLEVLHLDRFASAGERTAATKAQNQEFRILQALQGVAGIPRCLPPFTDPDRQIQVLPIQAFRGRSLEDFLQDTANSLSQQRLIEIIRQTARILDNCHQQDVGHGQLSAQSIQVLDTDAVLLSGWRRSATAEVSGVQSGTDARSRDVVALAQIAARTLADVEARDFEALQHRNPDEDDADDLLWPEPVAVAWPQLPGWVQQVLTGTRPLVEDLTAEPVSSPAAIAAEPEPFEARPGAVVNRTYRLVRRLGSGSTGDVWEAEHLLGEFTCCVKILTLEDNAEERARAEFQTLVDLFHPNIVRLFAFQKIEGCDRFCLVMGMGDQTLSEVIKETDEDLSGEQVFSWFRGLLSALQYLRRLDPSIIHRDVKPRNIVVTADHASLIDFNVSDLNSLHVGTLPYRSPEVAASTGWTPDADLYSLCLCFYELMYGYPFLGMMPDFDTPFVAKPMKGFPRGTYDTMIQTLKGQFPAADASLADVFALNEKRFSLEEGLPAAFRKQWNLIGKNEPYLIATLLQNGGRMTKNQLITNTLDWRRMSSSRRNRATQSATLAALRGKKLLDYPRGRQRARARVYVVLDQEVVDAWKGAT
jgi:serine/threonine protein kinase